MRTPAVLAVCACSLSFAAAPALADDASVERAWDAHDGQYQKLDLKLAKTAPAIERSHGKQVGPAVRVLRRMARLGARTRRQVRAEHPSSVTGTAAKRWALLQVADYVASVQLLELGLISGSRGLRTHDRSAVKRARKTLARSERHGMRAERRAVKARDLFREADSERANDTPPATTDPLHSTGEREALLETLLGRLFR